ncbi:hypothetical protein dsx2_2611 [Desulfovibrio sp. X2]|uniref:hypothetical protein n=1 Tax=Desulfovibrio sp. X2 TaxID=941449 RepID=UPI000358B4CB|nr:hypothetical protein [Desulfovibrio sp. X2]EPR42694.1 hypothetical protein dsx2_2611 [Desulfovibrio sp. X2]
MQITIKNKFAAMLTLGGDTSKLTPEDVAAAASSSDWRIRAAVAQAAGTRGIMSQLLDIFMRAIGA